MMFLAMNLHNMSGNESGDLTDKQAFADESYRIAPGLDTARRICVVESESGRIVQETQETLPKDLSVRKALHLMDLGAGSRG